MLLLQAQFENMPCENMTVGQYGSKADSTERRYEES
jgi:hypothetical protein